MVRSLRMIKQLRKFMVQFLTTLYHAWRKSISLCNYLHYTAFPNTSAAQNLFRPLQLDLRQMKKNVDCVTNSYFFNTHFAVSMSTSQLNRLELLMICQLIPLALES